MNNPNQPAPDQRKLHFRHYDRTKFTIMHLTLVIYNTLLTMVTNTDIHDTALDSNRFELLHALMQTLNTEHESYNQQRIQLWTLYGMSSIRKYRRRETVARVVWDAQVAKKQAEIMAASAQLAASGGVVLALGLGVAGGWRGFRLKFWRAPRCGG